MGRRIPQLLSYSPSWSAITIGAAFIHSPWNLELTSTYIEFRDRITYTAKLDVAIAVRLAKVELGFLVKNVHNARDIVFEARAVEFICEHD